MQLARDRAEAEQEKKERMIFFGVLILIGIVLDSYFFRGAVLRFFVGMVAALFGGGSWRYPNL